MPPTTIQEINLITPDGTCLNVIDNQVPNSPGTILVVHGLGEHSGCYDHVVALLNQVGLSVVRFDHRGHGHSSGTRGHITSYDDYLNDVTLVIESLFEQNPHRLIAIYGHSMGGGIVANWCLRRFSDRWQDQITGAILSAPWFRLTTPVAPWKIFLIDHFSRIVPRYPLSTKIRTQQLTKNEAIIERFRNDPLRHNQITLRTAIECHRAGKWALKNAKKFPIPLLAFHGVSDKITSIQATQRFCTAVTQAHFVPLENFIHEPHNDPRWREIFYHVIDWAYKRFPRASAA